ncbi:MAG: M20/M25/M40 family metallo-hydrolase [Lentisphaerae bacterium]|nr:M20/M25/M40 family metallo-hydrolase [Lentisphaerota bacterium]
MNLDRFSSSFDQNRDRIVSQWMELLAFPSISTEPAHHRDCLACAEWLVRHLHSIGFDNARLLQTPGKPVVFAERPGRPGKPVVLFYGHYDVQPVDPVSEWRTPPFTPTLLDGRMRARGAQDNKGQHFYALKALETLIRDDRLQATVKIIIEGEEECGSHGISATMTEWRERLQADLLLITDIAMDGPRTPTITMGLRGLIHLTAELSGPLRDLHSGAHGGVAPNPALELPRLLATLHARDGVIAVPGFYDGVQPISPEEKVLALSMPFDPELYRRQTGVPPTGGERGRPVAERLGLRPCIDVNGIHAGFDGPGVKTIIPAKARAKLTARLAAGQDPALCLAALEAHLRQHAPEGLTLTIVEKGVGGPGFRLSPQSEWIARAAATLRGMYNTEPTRRWEGASIPVIAGLARVSGAEPLLVGFGLEEDSIHAPNESFALEQFRNGYLYVASLLAGL